MKLFEITEKIEYNPIQYHLKRLPYAENALEPTISKETVHIHHKKHHQAYVDGLNKTLENYPKWASKSIEELLSNLGEVPKTIRDDINFYGGGMLNHDLFWRSMAPSPKERPTGELRRHISSHFGGLRILKYDFTEEAKNIRGSGWCWLVVGNKSLEIMTTEDQTSPLTKGKIPLLGLDMWEHSYYLDYQNNKEEYIKAWWKIVDWDKTEKRFKNSKKGLSWI